VGVDGTSGSMPPEPCRGGSLLHACRRGPVVVVDERASDPSIGNTVGLLKHRASEQTGLP